MADSRRAESRRSFFLEECARMAIGLARRRGQVADELRAEVARIGQALQSDDVVERLNAIEEPTRRSTRSSGSRSPSSSRR